MPSTSPRTSRKLTPFTACIVRSRCWKRTDRFSTSMAGVSVMAREDRAGAAMAGAGNHHVASNLVTSGDIVQFGRHASADLLGKGAAGAETPAGGRVDW